MRASELARRERQFKALVNADRKTTPILLKALRNEIPTDAAAQKIRRLVPNKRLARELFDHWSKAMSTKPEDLPRSAEEIARDDAALHRRGQLNKASKAIHEGFSRLLDPAMAGDTDAAKDLLENAVAAVQWLIVAERAQPEVFQKIARQQGLWPMMARDEPGWDKTAVERIQSLNLGADLRVLKARFRQVRGPDSSHPARQWAKAAVRVIEDTRWRMFSFAQLSRDFGTSEAFVDFTIKAGWDFGPRAQWSETLVGLPPFARAALAAWKKVIRQLIREEMPDFHSAAEWANQRNAAKHSGRDSRGEIQCAILDDICSALVRLAPEEVC